jgi:hypothetical protein
MMKTKLLICLILVLSILSIESAEAKKKEKISYDPEFVQFLKDFQAAVKSKDVNKIAGMCRFPLLEKWKYYEPITQEQFLSDYNGYIGKDVQKWVLKLKPKDFEYGEEDNDPNDPNAGTHINKTSFWCARSRPGSNNEEDNFFIEIIKFDGVYKVFSLA